MNSTLRARLKEDCKMTTPQPSVGDWYRLHGGESFEIVALDVDDGTIDIQYFDGTLEEMELEDWEAQCAEGAMESVGSFGRSQFSDGRLQANNQFKVWQCVKYYAAIWGQCFI